MKTSTRYSPEFRKRAVRLVREHARAARLRTLEHRIADLVNQAYGLADDDIDLLWRTAPPRMPGSTPAASRSQQKGISA